MSHLMHPSYVRSRSLTMPSSHSVTPWLSLLRDGNPEAAQRIWDRDPAAWLPGRPGGHRHELALLSVLAELPYRPPVAFVVGALGPLIGADLGETGGE